MIPSSKKLRIVLIVAVAAISASIVSLGFNKSAKKTAARPQKAIVHDKGERIEFKENSPGLEIIKSAEIGKQGEFVNVEAPARLIATTAPSVSNGDQIVLFESAELNDLYVGYVHAKNSLNRSRKNLDRIKDMFKHRVATEKDLVEAETEVNNDEAEFAEFEGKLRAVGLNPALLAKAASQTAWIISDVPESQLSNLQKGKRVKVVFSSFPNNEWNGTAEALGDNVDPYTRTVKVRIAIKNEGYRLKPGMFAVVRFPEETGGNSVVIPFTSVVTIEGKNYVFVEESPGDFFRREVVLGISTRERVNVLEGLTKGDRVVVEGAILLKGLSFGF
ncbi:HlyD family efflux transporter periplasmic adaptor subunit [Leptospira wolffii]|uniref:Efflux transporter periplasmic adaptor subunit n=1 Tax=Leptospira wolffii TaxID=409998 RepID=A0A2M9ZD80_9LEPT|nr:efflux RND transporter periplasmic adaptor subunit [Leptospira wolffii]EPG67422.1 HlyD family secretion protein [Leptospira wolffii serovar Khorat str. Khorat-H2]PJZ66388.1 efflux transporter periplasmic adaptor subunit [Leptospira wolffii]TGK60053.1 HlyD family efflux transporter periplasmic adaptor subunit [Leptospira wolffii]TGK72396.1 HlyD family efflux transporter periplasmic adaptor subunit [Leptospira wolffii]TGK76060.1 HlyD family efflux transporter periplasmic adaptor subunit [Lept